MNGVVHINWHAPLAVSGCDDWRPFEAGGYGLSLNHQQRPLSPVKDTSLWFPSQARYRPSSVYTCKQTHTWTHMLAFGTITGFRGRWLYYCCCNTALIQGRSDPSPFYSTSAPLDQILILPRPHEWSTQRGAALTPATCIKCHSGPYAVMQLLMGITVSYESWGSLMEAQNDRSERQTSEGNWSHISCTVNLEMIFCCFHRSTSLTHPPPGKPVTPLQKWLCPKQPLNWSFLGDTLT